MRVSGCVCGVGVYPPPSPVRDGIETPQYVPVPFALGTDSKYALVITPSQQVNLSYIAPYFNKLKDTTKVLWMLQEPVAEEKLSPNRAMITNQQITKYNKVAASVIEESSAQLWTSNVMIAKSYLKDSKGKKYSHGSHER